MSGTVTAWAVALAAMAAAGGALLPPAAVVAAVAGAALLAVAAGMRWRPDAVEGWGAAWLAWAALAGVAAADPLQAKQRVAFWAVALVVFAVARRGRAGRLARAAWATAGLALAAGAVAEGWTMGRPRAGGLAENPNLAGWLLVVAGWAVVPGARGRWRWPLAVVLAAGLAATGSRGAIAAALAGVAVAAPPRVRRLWPAAAAVAVLLLAWRFAVQPDPYAWRRPRLWAVAVRVVVDAPLTGATPGGYAEAARRHRFPEPTGLARWPKTPGSPESTLLVPLAESGLPGAVLALAAALAAARAVRRAPFSPAGVAGIVAAGAFLAVHDVSAVPAALWSAAWVVGSAVPPFPVRSAPPLRRRFAAAVVAGALGGWALVQPALAASVLWRARHAAGPEHRRAARRALRLEPWSWPALERLLATAPPAGPGTAGERIALARRLVAAHPGAARSWSRLGGELTAAVGRLGPAPVAVEEARRALARASELAPHDPWIWLLRAQLERAAGAPAGAVLLARRAVREEPTFVAGWLFLARAELDRGRLAAARVAVGRARAVLERARGRILDRYERALVTAPGWQLRRLEEALR